MSAPNSALSLTATGIASAVAAFCASVAFQHFVADHRQSQAVPSEQIFSLDALSISVRIAKEAKTPEEAEAYYKELEAMLGDLRASGQFVVDSRFVVAAPKDRVIGADEFFARLKAKEILQGKP